MGADFTSFARKEGDVGVTAKGNRLFVDAVLYRFRAGIPWRDLPERFGDPLAFQPLGQKRRLGAGLCPFSC